MIKLEEKRQEYKNLESQYFHAIVVLVESRLLGIINSNTQYGISIKRNIHDVSSVSSDRREVRRYVLFEIFSPERAYSSLQREIYLQVYPKEFLFSLHIDGQYVMKEKSLISDMEELYRLIDDRIKTMTCLSTNTSST